MLKAGDRAPEFESADSDGSKVRLSDFRGKKVVLYFYPRDDTPGCTKEACSFRDSSGAYAKKKMVVLGMSMDDEKSHKKFSEKYKLPFTLLADKDGSICRKYGAYGEKSMYGRKYMGIFRMTFIIDKKGVISKIFGKVKPEGHAKEVLESS